MEASSATKSRLIGAVLFEKGLITREQLDAALALQETTGERLGEIVVAEFGVSRLDLAGVLAEQWSGLEMAQGAPSKGSPPVDPFEPLTPDQVQIRRPIGEIFVDLGFVTADQLESALAQQTQSGARIGEILVEQGSMSRLDLASALVEQWSALRTIRPPQSPGSGDSELPPGVVALRRGGSARGGMPGALSNDPRDELNELRTAIGELEARMAASLEAAGTQNVADALRPVLARVDALEDAPVERDLAALREAVEALRGQLVEPHRLSELTDAVSRLEQRGTGVEATEALTGEIDALKERLDALADLGELRDRIDATAAQTDAVQHEILELAKQLEPLAALEARLAEIDPTADRIDANAIVARLQELDEEHGRLARLAATLESPDEVSAALEVMQARVEELARVVERRVDVEVVDVLRARVQEISASLESRALEDGGLESVVERLGAAESRLELVEGFDGRLSALAAELESRPEGDVVRVEMAALREELDRVREGVDAERASFAEVLASRGPIEDELASIRSRMAELAVAPSEDVALSERVEAVVSRLDELGGLDASIEGLREMVASIDAARGVDAVAVGERLAGVESSLGSLAAMESSLRDEVSRALEDGGLGSVVERLGAAESRLELVEGFDGRLSALAAELESRPEGDVVRVEMAALREELDRVREGVDAERASFAEVLASRGPIEDELASIRSRMAELAVAPSEDVALSERVEAVVSRLDELGGLDASIEGLREMVASIDAARGVDAVAVGERLAGVESSLGSLAAMESSLRDEVSRALEDGGLGSVVERLGAAESRLELVEGFDGRLSALAAELESRPGDDALAALHDMRERMETLAETTLLDDLGRRISAVEENYGQIASEAVPGIDGRLEELDARIGSQAEELGTRIDEAVRRIGDLVARDELDVSTAENVRWIQSELSALRNADDTRASSAEAAIRDVERRIGADLDGVRAGLDDSLGAVRSEARDEREEFRSLLASQDAEREEQRTKLERLDEEHAATAATLARVERMLADGLSALSDRFAEELSAVGRSTKKDVAEIRGEAASLGARMDEILALRDADIRDSRAAAERLDEQLEAIGAAHEDHVDASRAAIADLGDRMAGEWEALRRHVSETHAPVERLEARLEQFERAREEESATAGAAAVEMAERLDALSSRCEAMDEARVEARNEMQEETERLAASMGWRLEKIEESLAADDVTTLRHAVGDIERRLEGYVAVGETQAKATERALRKGLASLGERLVESESAYVEAGNRFRRAIERLGAAVVEADARMADQIPALPLDGCVAFAPTAEGYRLIELPGAPVDVGSTVEVECCDGPLVVTRYGVSPLPLDRRPCAYLERAEVED